MNVRYKRAASRRTVMATSLLAVFTLVFGTTTTHAGMSGYLEIPVPIATKTVYLSLMLDDATVEPIEINVESISDLKATLSWEYSGALSLTDGGCPAGALLGKTIKVTSTPDAYLSTTLTAQWKEQGALEQEPEEKTATRTVWLTADGDGGNRKLLRVSVCVW